MINGLRHCASTGNDWLTMVLILDFFFFFLGDSSSEDDSASEESDGEADEVPF